MIGDGRFTRYRHEFELRDDSAVSPYVLLSVHDEDTDSWAQEVVPAWELDATSLDLEAWLFERLTDNLRHQADDRTPAHRAPGKVEAA